MTFPNYYVVGPNIQFFFQHGVKGLFEEGNEAVPVFPLRISALVSLSRADGGSVIAAENRSSCFSRRWAGPAGAEGVCDGQHDVAPDAGSTPAYLGVPGGLLLCSRSTVCATCVYALTKVI